MPVLITDPSKTDPENRVTIRFTHDGSSVSYQLCDGKLIRYDLEPAGHRANGNHEEEFGKANLARAEKAADAYFASRPGTTYVSLLEARVMEFDRYVRVANATNDQEGSLYADKVLLPLAREFLKKRRWDMDAKSLVREAREYWTRLRTDRKSKERAAAPALKLKREARIWRDAEAARQQDLFL